MSGAIQILKENITINVNGLTFKLTCLYETKNMIKPLKEKKYTAGYDEISSQIEFIVTIFC